MKLLKRGDIKVMKVQAWAEERYFSGEADSYKQYLDVNAARTQGLQKIANEKFIVKDTITYLADDAVLAYFPDLNITVDFSWRYLQGYIRDVINCNKVWHTLNFSE